MLRTRLTPLALALGAALSFQASAVEPIRFEKSQIDGDVAVCTDLNEFVNKKWLAANPIPGDRSSWGAFEMLAERSSAVQQQLAEQAAARADASGIDKIVGDFYATGMDEAKINAQGIEPLKAHLAEIDALADTAGIANENIFGTATPCDSKNLVHGKFGASLSASAGDTGL